MSIRIARQAVVVGAGMGGLMAARALADHFERVHVLEWDTLPSDGSARRGIPQGRHAHALLLAGQRVLGELLPGFEDCLSRDGAVPVRLDRDVRREFAGSGPFPQRDAGFDCYAQSRPRLEATVRELLLRCSNVTMQERCRVRRLASSDDGRTVDGLVYIGPDGETRELHPDLIVEASGRGDLTLAFLEETGQARPEVTTIGVDMSYSSAIFEIPEDAPGGWKGVYTFPQPPHSSRGALLLPLEGNRWIVSLAGRPGEEPPGDPDGWMSFAGSLHSPTIHQAVSRAKRVGEIFRYQFPESIHRHYARLTSFPRGLLPIGDALCRFNPIYGQGMTVAALEAQALGRLLSERASEPDPLTGLAPAFFEAADRIVETPWVTAALPDLIYPDARGERPADFEQRVRKSAALNALAAADPDVHKLVLEVRHLLRSHHALDEPQLNARLAKMAGEA